MLQICANRWPSENDSIVAPEAATYLHVFLRQPEGASLMINTAIMILFSRINPLMALWMFLIKYVIFIYNNYKGEISCT